MCIRDRGWRHLGAGLGLVGAIAITLSGCVAEGAADEDLTAEEGETVAQREDGVSTGWNHVVWSTAGLYSIICMLDGTCPYQGYCSGPMKNFSAGHKFYVEKVLWRCGYWWSYGHDNYGNSGWMRSAALDPGW